MKSKPLAKRPFLRFCLLSGEPKPPLVTALAKTALASVEGSVLRGVSETCLTRNQLSVSAGPFLWMFILLPYPQGLAEKAALMPGLYLAKGVKPGVPLGLPRGPILVLPLPEEE